MIITETLFIKESDLTVNGLIPIDTDKKEFSMLMSLYKKAQIDILDKLRSFTRIF